MSKKKLVLNVDTTQSVLVSKKTRVRKNKKEKIAVLNEDATVTVHDFVNDSTDFIHVVTEKKSGKSILIEDYGEMMIAEAVFYKENPTQIDFENLILLINSK